MTHTWVLSRALVQPQTRRGRDDVLSDDDDEPTVRALLLYACTDVGCDETREDSFEGPLSSLPSLAAADGGVPDATARTITP